MNADEKIEVYVDGVCHVFASSDVAIVELYSNRTAKVSVNYAHESMEGLVSPKNARKLKGYSAKETATRALVDSEGEKEIEEGFLDIVTQHEKLRKLAKDKKAGKG